MYISQINLNPYHDGAANRWWGPKRTFLPKTCDTFNNNELGAIVPHLKKIQKMYNSCNMPLKFC